MNFSTILSLSLSLPLSFSHSPFLSLPFLLYLYSCSSLSIFSPLTLTWDFIGSVIFFCNRLGHRSYIFKNSSVSSNRDKMQIKQLVIWLLNIQWHTITPVQSSLPLSCSRVTEESTYSHQLLFCEERFVKSSPFHVAARWIQTQATTVGRCSRQKVVNNKLSVCVCVCVCVVQSHMTQQMHTEKTHTYTQYVQHEHVQQHSVRRTIV